MVEGADDAGDRAAFLRAVRQALLLIEEEMSRSRTGRQLRPRSDELRDVQRNLSEILDRPYRVSAQSQRTWDGRAARVVKEWPADNPVRRAVTQLWNLYTRRSH